MQRSIKSLVKCFIVLIAFSSIQVKADLPVFKIYNQSSYEIQFPEDWTTMRLIPHGLRGYALLGGGHFMTVDVSSNFLKGSDLQAIINSIHRAAVQQDVQNWITTSMENQFEDFEFVKIGAVEMQGKKWLHVQWAAIAKKDYFLKGDKGSKIFFSEYFTPDPQAWLKSYFLTCASSKWDEEVESCFEVIPQTLLLKKPEVK